MASELKFVDIPEDPLLSKLKTQCNRPEKSFGDIAVGPKGVVLPRAFMDHAQKILNMEVRPDDVWIVSIPRSGNFIQFSDLELSDLLSDADATCFILNQAQRGPKR